MSTVTFRFYQELNDFLPPYQRQRHFVHQFHRRASVKDIIESLGIPHTEVELILVDGKSVGFSHIVADGHHISVYPMFESLDISPLLKVRLRPLRQSRFVVDSNLGKLARYLRLLGFDSLYRNDYSDGEVAGIAQREGRIVLTRDRRLLRRKIITHGFFVRADAPRQQVKEVLARLDLYRAARPFSRCTLCNGELASVEKARVMDALQPKTRRYYHEFLECTHCRQVYWQGSHCKPMARLVAEFLKPLSAH